MGLLINLRASDVRGIAWAPMGGTMTVMDGVTKSNR